MNYIDRILSGSIFENEILKLFLLEPMRADNVSNYNADELKSVAEGLFEILQRTSPEVMLEILAAEVENLPVITAANIPQFSDISTIPAVLNVVAGNDKAGFPDIGYYFNHHGSEIARRKYGENHYKLAASLGLASDPTLRPLRLTFLGCAFRGLSESDQLMIRDKLILCVPIVQHILVVAKHSRIRVTDVLSEHLACSTAERRRANTCKLIDCVLSRCDKKFALLINENLVRSW